MRGKHESKGFRRRSAWRLWNGLMTLLGYATLLYFLIRAVVALLVRIQGSIG